MFTNASEVTEDTNKVAVIANEVGNKMTGNVEILSLGLAAVLISCLTIAVMMVANHYQQKRHDKDTLAAKKSHDDVMESVNNESKKEQERHNKVMEQNSQHMFIEMFMRDKEFTKKHEPQQTKTNGTA